MRSIRVIPLVLLAALALIVTTQPSEASADATKAVQRRLNAFGCDVGPVDGNLGTWTRAGIIRFQAANHVAQTGGLTQVTNAKLVAPTQVRCDRRPVVGHTSGRRVVISQGQNYVWLVRSGGTIAAQGPMVDNPGVLHRGTYHAGSKCGRSAKILNNHDVTGLRLHHFVRFAPCGIGFHQIPQYRSGRQIHSAHLLGTNYRRSHGCIRVSAAMSTRIWGFVHRGTRVLVVR